MSAPALNVATDAAAVDAAVRAIIDPEIPVITLDDLGVVREITVRADAGTVEVTITPTYSGCPAMAVIEEQIHRTVERHGLRAVVTTRLAPAWTTDWMSVQGRESLRRFGIAPPTGARPVGPVTLGLSVRQVSCPQCGSSQTEELSRFGSTACKALRRCLACREPFEEFKAI